MNIRNILTGLGLWYAHVKEGFKKYIHKDKGYFFIKNFAFI